MPPQMIPAYLLLSSMNWSSSVAEMLLLGGQRLVIPAHQDFTGVHAFLKAS